MIKNFGSNVFQGIVGGIFTSIVLWIFFKLRDYFAKQKGLKELFDIKDLSNYSLIVPSIYVSNIKQMQKSRRAITAKTDVPFFARNDIRASLLLYNLIEPICSHVDFVEDEKYKVKHNKNIVSIGGSSNEVTWKVLQEHNPKVHYLRYKPEDLDKIKDNPIKHYSKYLDVNGPFEEGIYDTSNDKLYKEDGKYTYSLILKLRPPQNNGATFVVCGLRSEATYIAARYLSHNWKQIRADLINIDKRYLSKVRVYFYTFIPWRCPEFAVILRINMANDSVDRTFISLN